MPCLRPLGANRDQHGSIHIRESLFEARWAEGEYLEVPCGTCGQCRQNRVREWAIRSFHESQTHTRFIRGAPIPNSVFITLTQTDEHCEEDSWSLNHRRFQIFMKRLRRDRSKIRFLQCGEYGSRNFTARPHYHACLFGVDFHEDRRLWTQQDGKTTWLSDELTYLWGRGHCTLDPLNFGTAAYTAGYVAKKLNKANEIADQAIYGSTYESIFQRKPEYITMSRRPGLGTEWFHRFWPEVYPADKVTLNGNHYRPPAFYDTLLLKQDPDLHAEVLAKRKLLVEDRPHTTQKTLDARNSIFNSKNRLKVERKNL